MSAMRVSSAIQNGPTPGRLGILSTEAGGKAHQNAALARLFQRRVHVPRSDHAFWRMIFQSSPPDLPGFGPIDMPSRAKRQLHVRYMPR